MGSSYFMFCSVSLRMIVLKDWQGIYDFLTKEQNTDNKLLIIELASY